MPIYEYVCRECGEPHEQLQRMSDDALTDCPACGKPALKRKVSAAGFRLSGGGWYETDFKSDGKRNLTGDSEKPSGADGAKSGESKSSESTSGDSAAKTTSKDSNSSAKTESSKPAKKSADKGGSSSSKPAG